MSTPTADAPDHAPALELALASVTARALYTVVQLGVPDMLADKALTAEEISERSGRRADPLHRVLRTLTGAGYFTQEEDRFGLTASGRPLVSGHPSAARDFVLTVLGPMFTGALLQLDATLRTGRTGTEEAFGQRLFGYLAQRPGEGESFDRMMIGFHGTEPAAVSAAYDFGDTTTIVDVGGGIGTLLRTVLEANPQIRGTLFDQPAVLANAQLGAAGERIALVAGDFFTAVPAGGDVYLLSHILHDWSDEECLRILRPCREALGPGGRLLIVEMVLPQDNTSHPAQFLDLVMLTITGGRERTPEQYRSLLARAGLELTRIIPTASAVSIVEATIAGR